ncbi:hypothetical protein ILUMI_21531 [Ignelater luminosus]|uniref:G-protein coupled receptors family 1 profile domain-containing protein n=1 Tax=Ignelater luminosus TaxID=2038154 RepID=A0A8K0CED7_IGNLU|nr:hypothetical protein ILUMI_21531 [Ignelater luminosus]
MVDVDLFNQQGMCQIMIYITGVCSFLSVWLVLAFTVERFVAVRYPLLRQSVCTVSRAKIVILILAVLAMLLFSPLLVFARVQYDQHRKIELCTIDPEWQRYANVFNVVDTVLTFIIPVIVIGILNTCISRTIWKLASVRRKLTYRGPPPTNLLNKRKGFIRHQRPKLKPVSQNKVTKMLLVVSTACLCLNLPSYIMRVLTYLIEVCK